ncbi:MAG: UDP-glucose--hexose-1-phosphate uridylyltransferase [Litorilinea sp.]
MSIPAVFDPGEHPHRRRNLLTGEWVLVSPHRTKRPWQGQVETATRTSRPAHDPTCYLCPGNLRAGGQQNPDYTTTYVFDNDFAALLPDSPQGTFSDHPLLQVEAETGICRVICFSPRHDLTLPEMPADAIAAVVDVWCAQTADLAARPHIHYVQLFENKGAVMGSSNPHPHGQLWATGSIPVEPAKEDARQRTYYQEHGSPLLLDYLDAELAAGARIVLEEDDWVALVPFWAVWPFETLVLSRRHVTHLPDLHVREQRGLARLLKRLLTRYDNLFATSFPYSMGWHGRPVDTLPVTPPAAGNNPGNNPDTNYAHWQLHAHFYPPLLRSATVKKFMVGFEMLAMPQRDITAEQAAARLRAQSDTHYEQA